jgi:hypothetical protein
LENNSVDQVVTNLAPDKDSLSALAVFLRRHHVAEGEKEKGRKGEGKEGRRKRYMKKGERERERGRDWETQFLSFCLSLSPSFVILGFELRASLCLLGRHSIT